MWLGFEPGVGRANKKKVAKWPQGSTSAGKMDVKDENNLAWSK